LNFSGIGCIDNDELYPAGSTKIQLCETTVEKICSDEEGITYKGIACKFDMYIVCICITGIAMQITLMFY